MTSVASPLADSSELGELGVYQLKRLWSRLMAARRGQRSHDLGDQHRDHIVSDALGLGLEQITQYVIRETPDFARFEHWIVETSGGVEPLQVQRINAALTGQPYPAGIRQMLAEIDAMPPVLSPEDLRFWETHGYVILHDAVPEDTREAAAQAIWQHLGANPAQPDSWYVQSRIMVQFFQHPAFTANRRSRRLHKAFAQLWGTSDLWVTTDRCGFNVPERPGWTFQGPDLHWDVSLAQPIPFGTQAILYLTDTPGEQGAFTCVPGFQHRIPQWLAELPPGANPHQQDLHALGSTPIAGRAGDLVIWHHALPHGSRPNRGTRPRIVQYINMYPTQQEFRETWI